MCDKPIIDKTVQVRHQKCAEILSRTAGDRQGTKEQHKKLHLMYISKKQS